MNLFIVRHGIAVDPDDSNVSCDEERWLTDEGKRRTREVAVGLRALGVRVDMILTSPLLRARQTAEILAEGLGVAEEPRVTDALRPGFSLSDLGEALLAVGPPESAMIVGHEPDFSELISTLVWGDDRGNITVKKASVALLTIDALPPSEGGVALEWLAPPKMLRALAPRGD